MALLARTWATRCWSAYCQELDRRPLVTKCLTGLAASFLGDALAQSASWRTAKQEQAQLRGQHDQNRRPAAHAGPALVYDPWRALRLCMYSVAVGTPWGHFWFALLDRSILPLRPSSPRAVVIKLLLDQLVSAPLGTALFFAGMKVLEGQPEHALGDVQRKFWPTLLAGYLLWVPVQTVNFLYVPPQQRILFISVVSVFWASLLSTMAASDTKHNPLSELEHMAHLPGHLHHLQEEQEELRQEELRKHK